MDTTDAPRNPISVRRRRKRRVGGEWVWVNEEGVPAGRQDDGSWIDGYFDVTEDVPAVSVPLTDADLAALDDMAYEDARNFVYWTDVDMPAPEMDSTILYNDFVYTPRDIRLRRNPNGREYVEVLATY